MEAAHPEGAIVFWTSEDDSDWLSDVSSGGNDDNPDEPPPAEDYCAPAFTAGPSGSWGWTAHGRLWSRLQVSTEDRQAADTLSAWQRPDDRWEVTLAETDSYDSLTYLTVCRFPSADEEEEPLPICCLQQLSTPYTIARSSAGITIVPGRDPGIVNIYTLNAARQGRKMDLQAQLYLGHYGKRRNNILVGEGRARMVNCLRFFRLAEKEYLLAAGKFGYKSSWLGYDVIVLLAFRLVFILGAGLALNKLNFQNR